MSTAGFLVLRNQFLSSTAVFISPCLRSPSSNLRRNSDSPETNYKSCDSLRRHARVSHKACPLLPRSPSLLSSTWTLPMVLFRQQELPIYIDSLPVGYLSYFMLFHGTQGIWDYSQDAAGFSYKFEPTGRDESYLPLFCFCE